MTENRIDLSEIPEIPWPRKGDTLFKQAEDSRQNACLQWMGGAFSAYTIGYREAADILLKHVLDDPRCQDLLILPMLFLYRHFVEIRLKYIITMGRKRIDVTAGIPIGHNLTELWDDARAVITDLYPNEDAEVLDSVGHCINQLANVDPDSTAFRYPTNTKGNPSLPQLTRIDVPNFAEKMTGLANLLDGASDALKEILDNATREAGGKR